MAIHKVALVFKPDCRAGQFSLAVTLPPLEITHVNVAVRVAEGAVALHMVEIEVSVIGGPVFENELTLTMGAAIK